MAIKEWRFEDYLYGPDLDDITSQATFVFPTKAARDAALVGDLVPVAGMTVHMLDDGITYKRITVAGSHYWAPEPGTFICSMNQTSIQSIDAFVPPSTYNPRTLSSLTTTWIRNLYGWFNTANSRFTPLCPGFYETEMSITAANASVSGVYRGGFIGLNGTAMSNAVPGSFAFWMTGGGGTVAGEQYPLRTGVVYLNGTTDFIIPAVVTSRSGTADTTYISASVSYPEVSSISIKYLGP